MTTAALAGYASSFYMETATRATMTTATGEDNAELLYTAVPPGTEGNSIEVIYADPGANSQELSISVSTARTITVNLATGAGGAITSTGQQIMDAINADTEASKWVTASLPATEDGTGIVTAMGSTSLADGSATTTVAFSDLSLVDLGDQIHWQAAAIADRYWVSGSQTVQKSKASVVETALVGDNNDLHFCAKTAGVAGDDITVTYTDPAGNDKTLAITVVGDDIDVSLATGPAGAITTIANEILAAINADEDAFALLKASLKTGSDGTGIVTALAETNLAGGTAYTTIDTGFTETSYLGLITFTVAIEEYDLMQISAGTKHIMEAVAHAYDFTVSPEVDLKEVTTFGSGGHKEFLPGLMGGTGEVSDYWVVPGHSGDLGSNLIAVFYVNTDTGRCRIEADGFLTGAPVSTSVGEVVSTKLTWTFSGTFYQWIDATY